MGLGDVDLLEEPGLGGGDKVSAAVSCSICIEAVTDNGDRSWAKLQCGHQFHLDCIGSAFNAKGAMQCPNCRKVEKGQWLYATGHRSLPEFNMDDWAHDEDLYDLSFSEMSFGVHWCPFSGLTRLPSSFDEGGDFASSAYHDLLGQHPLFAEQTAVSSSSHPCPYIAYVGIHPTPSSSSGSVSESPNFNNHWNSSGLANEIPTTFAFPGVDVHYPHGWGEHHPSTFQTSSSRIGNAEQQPSMPSVSHRAARTTNSDMPRPGSFVHPFLVSHSSARPAGTSVASPMIPPYPGSVARARDRVQALQAYFQQQPSNSPGVRAPVMSGGARRSNGHRGVHLPQVASSSSDHHHHHQPAASAGGFYFYPSAAASSGRSFQEAAESPSPIRFRSWEQREHTTTTFNTLPPQVERDPIWGPFYHQAAAASGSDSGGIRSSGNFCHRHGSDRMPSQNRS